MFSTEYICITDKHNTVYLVYSWQSLPQILQSVFSMNKKFIQTHSLSNFHPHITTGYIEYKSTISISHYTEQCKNKVQ